MAMPLRASAPDDRIERLAARLSKKFGDWQAKQPLRGGKPAGMRTLRNQLVERVPELLGTSHEQLRKLHHGELEWHNIRPPVILALANIYGVTVAWLAPDLVKLYGLPDQGSQSSGWVTAAEAA